MAATGWQATATELFQAYGTELAALRAGLRRGRSAEPLAKLQALYLDMDARLASMEDSTSVAAGRLEPAFRNAAKALARELVETNVLLKSSSEQVASRRAP